MSSMTLGVAKNGNGKLTTDNRIQVLLAAAFNVSISSCGRFCTNCCLSTQLFGLRRRCGNELEDDYQSQTGLLRALWKF